MLPRRLFVLPLLLLLGCAGLRPAAEPADPPRHSLWRVTGEKATVHLLGSVHLLRPDVYPLPDAIEQAYEDAGVLVFELDLDEAEAGAFQMIQRGLYTDGRTLDAELAPETTAALEAELAKLGLAAEPFLRMKPWLLAMTLTVLELQRAGYADSTGLDRHFFERARRDGKPIQALETLDEQLTIFDGMQAADQEAFLRATLVSLDDLSTQMDTVTAAWQRGDTDALETLLLNELAPYPGLADALLDRRNRAWLAPIENLLNGERDALVVVGALHLVGADSVVDLLRQRGYRVEQR